MSYIIRSISKFKRLAGHAGRVLRTRHLGYKNVRECVMKGVWKVGDGERCDNRDVQALKNKKIEERKVYLLTIAKYVSKSNYKTNKQILAFFTS